MKAGHSRDYSEQDSASSNFSSLVAASGVGLLDDDSRRRMNALHAESAR